MTDTNPLAQHEPLPSLYGMVQIQALVISMKEIYGWLLIASLLSLLVILLSYEPIHPQAFFPSWGRIRRLLLLSH